MNILKVTAKLTAAAAIAAMLSIFGTVLANYTIQKGWLDITEAIFFACFIAVIIPVYHGLKMATHIMTSNSKK